LDFLDFLPLVREDADSIRARFDATANQGLTPSDDRYIDLSVGGFYYDVTQAAVLEIERLWDLLATEMVAAMLPDFAWGQYLDWHGDTYGVPRKDASKATGTITFSGTNDTPVPTGTTVATEPANADEDAVEFVTTQAGTITAGTLTVSIEAAEAGAAGNVAVGTITQLLTPASGVDSLTNAAATGGGADVETDEEYRARLLLEVASPQGAGNAADYERWALAYPGVGKVRVDPVWSGAGTVRVIITDVDNNPVSQETIDGLQAQLDPVSGEGAGLAPIGATVTVATASLVSVAVAATISFDAGYSLDGTAGTIAAREAITDSIKAYIDVLPPGEDVVLEHVKARIFMVEGVYDLSGVTLNGSAANVVISPTEIATTGTLTLT
jgi:uncharacterized phage protein gp47/JayE